MAEGSLRDHKLTWKLKAIVMEDIKAILSTLIACTCVEQGGEKWLRLNTLSNSALVG